MPAQRYCDFCLQPFMGHGDRSNCTLTCPSRRGQGRGEVVDELRLGHIPEGVHPRSRLVMEAQTHLMLNAQSNEATIQDLQDQVVALQNRLRWHEQRRDELRTLLLRLVTYRAGGHDANQRSISFQPESEPAVHDE